MSEIMTRYYKFEVSLNGTSLVVEYVFVESSSESNFLSKLKFHKSQ